LGCDEFETKPNNNGAAFISLRFQLNQSVASTEAIGGMRVRKNGKSTMSKDVMSTVLALLVEKVGRQRFDLWFGSQTHFSLNGATLVVAAPNTFLQNWQRQHYRPELEAACRAATANENCAVEFRVRAALPPGESPSNGGTATKLALGQTPADCANNSLSQGDAGEGLSANGKSDRSFSVSSAIDTISTDMPASSVVAKLAALAPVKAYIAPPSNGHGHHPEATCTRRRFATLSSFVVGCGNRLAHASSQMVVEKPGSLTPLLIHGGHGSGKTHLLEGIWTAARTHGRALNCVYLSAEQFTTFFVAAARGGSGMPNFRRKYRTVDLLLIDDLQFLAGKKGTLVELLQTIDAALREGRQLVFAADRPPAELTGLGPELSTRLAGGMVCHLESPDLQMRIGLAQQFAQRLGFELPIDVAEVVAGQVTSGPRELCGTINRLHATSRMLNCPIDRAFAEQTLAEMSRHSTKAVRLPDIERAVCEVFHLPKESLQSQRRAKQVSGPRMLAMWLARKYTRAGLTEIGQYFGRRSHSTVISAHKRVTDWIGDRSEIEVSNTRCKIDEALRRVELQLRTG
jgi:chromosomal replication initiator protein